MSITTDKDILMPQQTMTYSDSQKKLFRNRLIRLAELLEKLPRRSFNFGTWAGTTRRPYTCDKDLECGTPACALGWATTFPIAKKMGIKLVPHIDTTFTPPRVCRVTVSSDRYNRDDPEGAAEMLFGVDDTDVFSCLFQATDWSEGSSPECTSSAYRILGVNVGIKPLRSTATAKQVAKNIRIMTDWMYPKVGK